MKVKIHVPTIEYGFIEAEYDDISAEDAVSHHNDLLNAYKGNFGLSRDDFNRTLDEFLNTGTVVDGVNIYQQMSKEQQSVFQEIKKSLKRIQAKNNKE